MVKSAVWVERYSFPFVYISKYSAEGQNNPIHQTEWIMTFLLLGCKVPSRKRWYEHTVSNGRILDLSKLRVEQRTIWVKLHLFRICYPLDLPSSRTENLLLPQQKYATLKLLDCKLLGRTRRRGLGKTIKVGRICAQSC